MDWVTLNVGGTSFSSLRSTLTSEPLSLLAKMVTAQSPQPPLSPCLECCASDMMQNTMSGACPHRATSDGESVIQVDCDPAAFSVILNCLRHGVIAIPPYLPVQLIKAAASSLGLAHVETKLEEFERKGTSKKEWLKLNVGGRIFETTRATLTSHPSSSLAKMFEPRSALPPTLMEDGVYQVDACPRAFAVILNWLRYRQLMLGNIGAEEVVPVADFFHVTDLSDALGDHLRKEEEERDAKAEVLENSTDRMENVLERVHGELNSCAEKLDDIKMEVASVGTSLEDLWRIKCEVTNLVQATKLNN